MADRLDFMDSLLSTWIFLKPFHTFQLRIATVARQLSSPELRFGVSDANAELDDLLGPTTPTIYESASIEHVCYERIP